jgi:hypothetical protein
MASATMNFPAKLTEGGTEQAKDGLSMADMIARMVAEQVAKAQLAVVGRGVGVSGGSGKVQSAKGKGGVKVSGGGVKRNGGVSKVARGRDEERVVFDARVHFSLGPAIAQTADSAAYVAESADETYANNPIVFVGVQRKAICLSEAKARVMLALLEAYFTEPSK